MADRWIQGAIKRKGDLTRKAKRKGMTVAEYCSQPKSLLSTRSVEQCNLYKTLRKFNKKKK